MLNINYKNYNNNAPINAFITNLGKYNEGELIGQWVSFPLTEEEMKEVLENIGINAQYEEYFMTDYEFNMNGLNWQNFGEYCSIETLNQAAQAIEDLEEYDHNKLNALIEAGEYSNILEAIENLDRWELLEDVSSDSELGYYYADAGCIDIPEHLQMYFDYEAYGRDCAINEGGTYTSQGYLYYC